MSDNQLQAQTPAPTHEVNLNGNTSGMTNGMSGRLLPFKFPTSGYEIAIKPVSPILITQLRRAFPQPEAPLESIERPDGSKIEERNPHADSHRAAMDTWALDFADRTRRMYVQLGVVKRLTDAERAEVTQVREVMAAQGVTLEDDDRVVWVSYVAIQSNEDFTALMTAIQSLSRPTDPKSTAGSTITTSESAG